MGCAAGADVVEDEELSGCGGGGFRGLLFFVGKLEIMGTLGGGRERGVPFER